MENKAPSHCRAKAKAVLILVAAVMLAPTVVKLIAKLSDGTCIINPSEMFGDLLRPVVDCSNLVPTYRELDVNTFRERHYKTGRPCVVKAVLQNWSALDVFSFEYFRQLYLNDSPHALAIQEERCQFFPYATEFQSLEEALLMTDERRRQKAWYIGWSNCDMYVAERLRQHYKRPDFIPKSASSSPIDWIFMGTPGKGAHLHVDNVGRISWQAQIRGSKQWRLQPPRECFFNCQRELTVTVEPGDMSFGQHKHYDWLRIFLKFSFRNSRGLGALLQCFMRLLQRKEYCKL